MELRHIRYFIRAAELLHFTRAAESLYVSQPTLSIHIQQLEEELGATLFERAGRHARPVRLTEAGHRLLKHLRNALRELELGKEDVAELSWTGERHAALWIDACIQPAAGVHRAFGFYRQVSGNPHCHETRNVHRH